MNAYLKDMPMKQIKTYCGNLLCHNKLKALRELYKAKKNNIYLIRKNL